MPWPEPAFWNVMNELYHFLSYFFLQKKKKKQNGKPQNFFCQHRNAERKKHTWRFSSWNEEWETVRTTPSVQRMSDENWHLLILNVESSPADDAERKYMWTADLHTFLCCC